jgi:ABC-type transporter Mla subunit MlaD
MANVQQFTRPLAERSERIIASIEGSAANLDELLAQLVHLSDGINQRQGTLGKLVFDDDIYLQIGEPSETSRS